MIRSYKFCLLVAVGLLICASSTLSCRKAAPTKKVAWPTTVVVNDVMASLPASQPSPADIQARRKIAARLIGPAVRKASELFLAATRPAGPVPDPYLQLLRQADRALAGGDYHTAETLFRQASQSQPRRLEAYEGLATTLSAADQFDAAASVYEKIVALAQREQPSGTTASQLDDRLRQTRTIALHNLAVARCHLGELAEGERIYRQLIEEDPEAVQFRFNLATVLQARGMAGEAVAAWLEVARQADKLPRADAACAWAALGSLQLDLGKSEQAFDAYVHLTQLTPDDSQAWLSYSVAARGCGSLGRAIAGAKRAIAISPANDSLHENLGDLYADLYGQTSRREYLESAIESWRRSLAINPRQPALAGLVEQYSKVLDTIRTTQPATTTMTATSTTSPKYSSFILAACCCRAY